MGMVAILVMWPRPPRTNFRSPIPLKLHMKFGFDWPSGFGEEDLSKWWTMDGQRRTDDEPCLYYKLNNEPKGLGELKIVNWQYFKTHCETTLGDSIKKCSEIRASKTKHLFIYFIRTKHSILFKSFKEPGSIRPIFGLKIWKIWNSLEFYSQYKDITPQNMKTCLKF